MAHSLDDFVVDVTDTIRFAMEKIELNKHRAVVVVDGSTVVGVVSDGDIRRAFLHNVLPIAPVSGIMQLNPRTTTESDSSKRRQLIQDARVTVLPVVTDDNSLVDVELAYEPFDAA